MDSVIGLRGQDFVMIAAEKSIAYSIIRLSDNKDKTINIGDKKVLCLVGNYADSANFGNFVKRYTDLYYFKNKQKELSTHALANYIRNEVSDALRKGGLNVNTMIGGFDNETASLYWIDMLGTVVKTNRAAHGYAGHFLLGLLDNLYKDDISKEDGLEIIKSCINELRKRFLISQKEFLVKVITKNGIEKIDL